MHSIQDRRTRINDLAIEHLTACNVELAEQNAMLLTENAGLRNDLAWCKDVIAAAVDRLSAAHIAKLKLTEQYNKLRTETTTLPTPPSGRRRPVRPMFRGTQANTPRPGLPCC